MIYNKKEAIIYRTKEEDIEKRKVTMNTIIFAIVAICIIILTYALWGKYTPIYDNYIQGLWVSDQNFNSTADINSMMIMIGETKKQKADCYIAIDDSVNMPFILNYSNTSGLQNSLKPQTFKAQILDSADSIEDETILEVFPRDVYIDLDVLRGQLRIRSKDTIYAIMYKNLEATDNLDEEDDEDDD